MTAPDLSATAPSNTQFATAAAEQPAIAMPSLPKGGGAIRGIGEKISVATATGALVATIPLPLSPGRDNFSPRLELAYDASVGNGPFGLGWSLSLPRIARKTELGLPRYCDAEESDVFVLSEAEDLGPMLRADGSRDSTTRIVAGQTWQVDRYRPRVEAAFHRIERWTEQATGLAQWRTTSRDNVTTVFGDSAASRVADPDDPRRIFAWLPARSWDDRGNLIVHEYRAEDRANVVPAISEENRAVGAQRYLKRLLYAFATPYDPAGALPDDWSLQLCLDYGEHDPAAPTLAEPRTWPVRPDPFSTYRPGFEVRSYRLCRRVLMVHRFAQLGANPMVVRTATFGYEDDGVTPDRSRFGAKIVSVTATGYRRVQGALVADTLPPVELDYTQATIDPTVRLLSDADAANLPEGVDGARYRLIDVDGEGLPGVLSPQLGAWHYKRGATHFDPNGATPPLAGFQPLATMQSWPRPGPAETAYLADISGEGVIALADLAGPAPTFSERDGAGGWSRPRAFSSAPHVDWRGLPWGGQAGGGVAWHLVDLDGDGRADLLLAGDTALTWYPSLGRDGFGPAHAVPMPRDGDRLPRLIAREATETLFLSDMSGDGLSDLVRIRPNEVAYWPAQGYGRFGAKIAMAAAPAFDAPDQFDPARLRLADIDGSGTTDLVYFGRDATRIWRNCAGNGFAAPIVLNAIPTADSVASVSVLDLLGTGTATIVWSSPLPSQRPAGLRYIDLMGGVKPHLLSAVRNNLGAETRVRHTPSTAFYLADRAAGQPWRTRLPFPVHVVAEMEVFDHPTQTKLATRFAYHHGAFDGVEREFRGFGRIEQWDTQSLSRFSGNGLFTEVPLTAGDEFHLPPSRTVTWFHLGLENQALGSEPGAGQFWREEYWNGDAAAPPPPLDILPAGLDPAAAREAARALKGRVLRIELYAEDGTAAAPLPFSVSSFAYTVDLVQAHGGNRHAVFFAHQREAVARHYERDPADPRTQHDLTLEVDAFGTVRRSAAIAYPRRPVAARLPEQAVAKMTVMEADVVYLDNAVGPYRLGLHTESRSYELTGATPAGDLFTVSELAGLIAAAPRLAFDATPPVSAALRLIGRERTIYRADNLSGPLPLGTAQGLGLVYETHHLALTAAGIAAAFPGGITDAVLTGEGGYIHSQGDPDWWIPSGLVFFSPNDADPPAQELTFAQAHFFRPRRFADPFGNVGRVSYDALDFLTARTEDAAGNVTTARGNYRLLIPDLMTDANGDRQAARFDGLGMVLSSFAMGPDGSGIGDTFDAASFETSPADDPGIVLTYHPDRFHSGLGPISAETRVRERFNDAASLWQRRVAWSDGSGMIILQKVPAAPGPAPLRDAGGALRHDGAGAVIIGDSNPRWIGNGRVVRDNKGNVVKQYEPFFDSSDAFTEETDLVEIGVTAIRRYDPLNRLFRVDQPDGTFTTIAFDPWRSITSDANDTVLGSAWFVSRGSPPPGGPAPPVSNPVRRAAWLAAQHADTPLVQHEDALGRVILTVADNGAAGKLETRPILDINGRETALIDALGRRVIEISPGVMGQPLLTRSMDAGERRILPAADGHMIRAFNGLGGVFEQHYDALRRPLRRLYTPMVGAQVPVEVLLYGEAHPDATRRLRGRLFRRYDSAGAATNERFDFTGNLTDSSLALLRDRTAPAGWAVLAGIATIAAAEAAAAPLLDPVAFARTAQFDALRRPVQIITPHGGALPPNVLQPGYDAGGTVARLDVWYRLAVPPPGLLAPATASDTPLRAVTYNAKGQRLTVTHGNGAIVTHAYDPETFRLVEMKTTRAGPAVPAGEKLAQLLDYVYDATGNVTSVLDGATDAIFFDNQKVDPNQHFTYDPLYRLISAQGREHLSVAGGAPTQPGADDAAWRVAHRADGRQMGTYGETYGYDDVGNLLSLVHTGGGGGWTRHYAYSAPSLLEPARFNNRLMATSLPGDPAAGPYSATYDYDAQGKLTQAPHLTRIDWDWNDRLSATARQAGASAETTVFGYDMPGARRWKATYRASAGGGTGTLKQERLYLDGVEVVRCFAADGTTVTLRREILSLSDSVEAIGRVETATVSNKANDPIDTPRIRYTYGNHLGSVALELDEQARVISCEEYFPYGGTAVQSRDAAVRAASKRYRYQGKERDTETGFDFFGARYYASWLGRWTAADPAGLADGPNPFMFAHDNPVMLRDPSGTEAKTAKPPAKFDPEYAKKMQTLYAGHHTTGHGPGKPHGKPPKPPPPPPPPPGSKQGTGHDERSQPGQNTGAPVATQGVPGDQPGGTHAPGGKGVVKQGGSSTAAEGGHGDKQTGEPPKTETDYGLLLAETQNPPFLESVLSLFGKKGEEVNSGGLSFGMGPKENASEGGQAAVIGTNIIFTFLDAFMAAGKRVFGKFGKKADLAAALEKEIRAGKIASEGVNDVLKRGAALTPAEEAAAKAYGEAILKGKSPGQAGTIAHDVAGANVHPEGARYGQTNSPAIKPGPDFVKNGGAAAQELKFHAGYMTPEQFQNATAQTLADSIVYQQGTGLVKLRLPTIHIYVNLKTGEMVKYLQMF